MNWMVNLIRSRSRASRTDARPARESSRRGRHLAIEPLEGRTLLSLSSFFTGLFPTYKSTTTATPKQFVKLLNDPPNVSYPPYKISTEVANLNDPGSTGQLFNSKILVDGYAPPFAAVWLAYGTTGYFTTVTRADKAGYFVLLATVPQGTSSIRTFAESLDKAYSDVNTITVNYSNSIVAWDAIALRAIQDSHLSAEEATRDLAILHTAQYDAVAAATNPKSAFAVQATAQPGASPTAAANAAAEAVLLALFPSYATAFTKASIAGTAGAKLTPAELKGASLGAEVAQKTLATRANDGSAITTAGGAIGLNLNWSQVKPFVLTSASEFRPAAPPTAGTSTFDQALSEVAALGRFTSTTRNADQTAAALYWDDPVGTSTTAGHWNTIAEQFAIARKTNLLATARAFAQLDVALADAAIASADAKVTYAVPRPITTIQRTDPTWTPLLATPTTPSYDSQHAAIAAAASDILSATYAKTTRFAAAAPNSTPANNRTFKSFAAAATEDANSRIAGGVSYRFDTTAGSAVGDSVGKAVLAKFPKK